VHLVSQTVGDAIVKILTLGSSATSDLLEMQQQQQQQRVTAVYREPNSPKASVVV